MDATPTSPLCTATHCERARAKCRRPRRLTCSQVVGPCARCQHLGIALGQCACSATRRPALCRGDGAQTGDTVAPAKKARRTLTPKQRTRVRSLVENSGYSRRDAVALVSTVSL